MEKDFSYFEDRINEVIDSLENKDFPAAEQMLVSSLQELLVTYKNLPKTVKNPGYIITEFLFFRFNKAVENRFGKLKDDLIKDYPLNSKLLLAVRDANVIHAIIFQMMCNFDNSQPEHSFEEISEILNDYKLGRNVKLYPHRFEYVERAEQGTSNVIIYVSKLGIDSSTHILSY